MLPENLNIYKETFKFVDFLYKVVSKMSRLIKFTLGQKMLDQSIDLFKYIIRANKRFDEERVKELDNFIDTFDNIVVIIRLCDKEGAIVMADMAKILIYTGSIGKQSNAWRSSTQNKIVTSPKKAVENGKSYVKKNKVAVKNKKNYSDPNSENLDNNNPFLT